MKLWQQKNSNCDKNAKYDISKTKIVTKENSKTKKTKKVTNPELWHSSKTQIVTKLKNSNYDKDQKFKLWHEVKTQIATKLKISNCDKTQKT